MQSALKIPLASVDAQGSGFGLAELCGRSPAIDTPLRRDYGSFFVPVERLACMVMQDKAAGLLYHLVLTWEVQARVA